MYTAKVNIGGLYNNKLIKIKKEKEFFYLVYV